MGKKLILCEKPSVANSVVQALGKGIKKEGYIECGEYYITWAFGHLIDIDTDKIAGKEWKLEILPIVPQKFLYKPIDKLRAKQLKIISELLKKVDEVHLYTDAGREGELIGRLILNYLGWKGKVMRFWTSLALTPEVIKKEMQNLKPASYFDSLYYSGLARQHADWIVGINLTRGITLKIRNKEIWSVGRVQTPTLYLLYQRDEERRKFKPTLYNIIKGLFQKDKNTCEGFLLNLEKKINTKKEDIDDEDEQEEKEILSKYAFSLEKANKIFKDLKNEKFGVVDKIIKQYKKEAPPLLFSLTLLQRHMNSTYGWKASKTLNVLQTLYEKAYVSYPRTDSSYLGEENKDLVRSILIKLGRKDLLQKVDLVGKRVFDNTKLTDHHAIIPLKDNKGELLGDEKLLFEEIKKRFLAAFYPDYEYEDVYIHIKVKNYIFEIKGIKILKLGWKELYGKGKEIDLSFLKQGDKVFVKNIKKEERQTSPPPLYTEGKLLKIMEKLNLGTPATRASIIENLKNMKYIESQGGKSLNITPKGRALIEALQKLNSKLLNVNLTSEWEKSLDNIYKQKLTYNAYKQFIEKIANFTKEEINRIKINLNVDDYLKEKTEEFKRSKKELRNFGVKSKKNKFSWRQEKKKKELRLGKKKVKKQNF